MDASDRGRQPGAGLGRRLTPIAALAALAVLALVACGREGGGHPAHPTQPAQPAQAPHPVQPAFTRTDLDAALSAIADAPAQGFAPGAFGDAARIAALIGSPDPDQQVEGRIALRKALIAYARAEHGLGLPRGAFPKEWGLRPAPYDAGAELDEALAQGRFAAWLAALPPSAPPYRALVRALGAYRRLEARGGWTPIPGGPDLRPRDRGPRVAALRARLAVEDPGLAASPQAPRAVSSRARERRRAGELGPWNSRRRAGELGPWNPAPPKNLYDARLAQAVAGAQRRYGLHPTGVADAATLAALNTPVGARVNQIRANLERWRWLPRSLPATRVVVDAAGGVMDYFENGRPALHMEAAAGKPDDKTPMLISTITQVEFNPPWRVPARIAAKELWPKERRHHGYLRRHHFVRGISRAAPLVQKPGPKSALGEVKFEFDNPYGVYLHDTPVKSAFALTQRQVSHGCVRLERATDLAKALLAPAGWSPLEVDQAIAGAATSKVTLPRPTAVLLLYWTAQVQGGRVNFRQDPYGWDDLLVGLLDGVPLSQRGELSL